MKFPGRRITLSENRGQSNDGMYEDKTFEMASKKLKVP